jgi:1-deoxy-D-xylulose-5-phosphate reductoisomerase
MPSTGRPRRIVVLGSTGSIGTQTLDVVARLGPERAQIVGLAAHRNVARLIEQVRATCATHAAVTDPAAAAELESGLHSTDAHFANPPLPLRAEGAKAPLTALATLPEADTVIVAVAGAAGLEATLAACQAGKRVCIATKEVLVAAGELVMRTARENGAEILPIDSEHSAIFQCVQGYKAKDIERIHITASGGPFRTWTAEQIARAQPADALKHPTWRMGGKITIDSATLMNKGLEIIEAVHLFGVPLDAVHVVVHPQSVVHSFVEMRDGALLAQLGLPDMRLPIQIALMHPEKVDTCLPRLKPAAIGSLTFEEPDHERFPAIRLARSAAATGGTAPAILNAANECAVAAFLDQRIGFLDIGALVANALDAVPAMPADSLRMILEADAAARNFISKRTGIK